MLFAVGCGGAVSGAPLSTASPAADQAWIWPTIDPDGVVVLEVTTEGGTTVRFERRGDAWRITSPIDGRADAGDVVILLDHLVELVPADPELREGPVPPPRSDALEPPVRVVARSASETVLDVEIGGSDDGLTQIRGHGRTTPFEWAHGAWRFVVVRELDEWRDELLFGRCDDLERVVWDAAGTHLEVSVDPAGRLVDASGAVSEHAPSIVGSLCNLRASAFTDLPLEAAGIGPTSERASIVSEHDATRTVVLGGPAGTDGRRYAAIDGEPTVYVLDPYRAAFVAMTEETLSTGVVRGAVAGAVEPPSDDEGAPPDGSAASVDDLPPEIRRALEEAMRGSDGSAPSNEK